jgi:predicted transcriptional regulator
LSLRNPNRIRTKQIISLVPGIHLRKLQKLLGTSFSTTRYHVDSLERDNEVASLDDGHYHRLYPAGTDDSLKTVYATFQSKTARKILRALAESQSGLTNGDLSIAVHMPKSTVSEYATTLGRVHLVTRSLTMDGQTLYEVQDREKVGRLIAVFEKNLLTLATGRFVDLWDI